MGPYHALSLDLGDVGRGGGVGGFGAEVEVLKLGGEGGLIRGWSGVGKGGEEGRVCRLA